MNIAEVLNQLKFSLEHSLVEEELLEAITHDLTILRQAYSAERGHFSAADIAFLKQLTPISNQLCSFIELKDELAYVSSLKHYTFLMNQLVDIKEALNHLPISKRVNKEIRELNEKLPSIREQDNQRQQARINSRILDLEQNGPHCPRKHKMVIREGKYGYFWGCSRYPMCQHKEQLNPAERERLYL